MRPCLFTLTAFLLLLPFVCNAADAEPIGRLFSTPAQRTRLDQLRLLGDQDAPVSEPPAATFPPPSEPVSEQFTLDGFVKRSSGKSTTWINRIPHNEHEISQGIRVRQRLSKPPSISVMLPSGKRLDLKAGQIFDTASNKISEVYEQAPATPAPKVSK